MTGFPEPEDYTGAPDDEDVTAAAGMTGFPEQDYTGPPEAPVTAGMTGFPEQDYTGPPEAPVTGAGLACAGDVCAGDAADVESSSPAGEEDGHNHKRCMKHHNNNKKFCDCKLTHKHKYCRNKFL